MTKKHAPKRGVAALAAALGAGLLASCGPAEETPETDEIVPPSQDEPGSAPETAPNPNDPMDENDPLPDNDTDPLPGDSLPDDPVR